MNIAGWALGHRTLVLLVLAVALAGGVFASLNLPSGIYPEVDFPRIGVVVHAGSTPPSIFQTAITRPLEQALMSVQGVQRVRSRTIRGGADMSLLFAPSTNMWRALQLVQARLNDAKAGLPMATEIEVERLTPVFFPILSFNLTGRMDSRALHDLAEYSIRPVIARVPGVGRVTVLGGDIREMEIIVDPARAASLHLRPVDIAARVRAAIVLAATGRFNEDRALVSMMASGEARGAADLASVPIAMDTQGVPIALRTVATVVEGTVDRLFKTQGPRGETVLLTVARLENASTPDVAQAVRDAMDRLKPALPPGVELEPVYDQGQLVVESMASVRDAVLLGTVLCIIVLGLFLRDARAGFVAAVAVPVTLVITFLAMYALKQTLNLMSLGGMAVAVGLVVDDSIVIVESIARRLECGESAENAAVQGSRELAAAVVGTTITTVIVFLPLISLAGVVGKFFSALATTLSSAVLISLVVSLTVIPIAAARFMRPHPRQQSHRMGGAYGKLIRQTAPHAWIGLGGSTLALIFCMVAISHVPSGFMPSSDEGAFVMDYATPAATSLNETDASMRRVEEILRATPEVLTFSRRTGAQLNSAAATLINTGDVMVRLRSGHRRPIYDVIAELRTRIERDIPQLRVDFVQVIEDMLNDLSGTPRPIEVKLFGEDYAVLAKLAANLQQRLSKVPGLVDLYGGVEGASPELVSHIDRTAAARLGLTSTDIADDLTVALQGAVVGTMRHFDRLIGIRLRYPDSVRFSPQEIERLPITIAQGSTVGLQSVSALERTNSPTVLLHEGLQPVVILTADLQDRDLGAVVRDIEAIMHEVHLPLGYRYELGGQYQGQQETLRNLSTVTATGLLLVLIVLVAQFGSLCPALAVLCTAPLALFGALGTLWVTQTPLNVSSLMGCVLLVGLVVKNGILLLEAAEEKMRDGTSYVEALAHAGERRIRPIVMTTFATVFGLAPLALGIGAGAELQRPLALAVIGGLVVSTGTSLMVLPSLACWLHKVASRSCGDGAS